MRAVRVWMVATLATICALLPSHMAVRAGGNIEILNSTGSTIFNAAWDKRSLPTRWLINRGPFSTGQLRPPLETAFDTWENLPDNDWSFQFGGTTAANTLGVDGKNVAIFGADFTSVPNFIAVTPCTVKNAPFTVADTGGPLPDILGDGLGWIRVGAVNVLLVPIGDYPAGTVVDCDSVFNTATVCSNNPNVLCDPASFDPFSDCGDFGATCDLFVPFTFGLVPGTEDVQGIALHEFGHYGTLSHSTLPSAVMYPFADTNPGGDGAGSNRILTQDDISAAAHYYKDGNFDSNNGRITGRVTMVINDGTGTPVSVGGDGVAVTALDANTLEPVAARFSYSLFMDTTDQFDGADRAAFGDGYYALEVPPGDYYVFAEWFDGRDDEFFGERLYARHNLTVANSAVADGDPADFAGAFGLLPERFEFHNSSESADGGDGISPGAAADTPDAAALVSVPLGGTVNGIDIVINLDPDVTKTDAARSNPTGVARADLTPFDRPALLLLDNDGNDDDWWLPHYRASDLPTPPYVVLTGVWTKVGLSDQPYIGGLLLADPADPNLIEPFVVYDARRTVTGWDGGNTGRTEIFEVRDRFNVTINQPRDLFFAIKIPESPPGITFGSEAYLALVQNNGVCSNNSAIQCSFDANCPGPGLCNTGSTGRSLLTPDDFTNFFSTTIHDVMYRVKTETAPPVMLNAASPETLSQGETGTVVTLTGAGFQPGAQVEILAPSFGPHVASGVTVISVNFVSSTTLEVTVDVDPAALPTLLDVKLTNPEVVIPNYARLLALIEAPDTDGDTVVDPIDCRPADPNIWSVPGTIGNTLQVELTGPDTVRIFWESPADPGGVPAAITLVTDVTQGTQATLLGSGGLDYGLCLANDLPVLELFDATPLAQGETRLYMAASENDCGRGVFTGPAGSANRNTNPGNCPVTGS